MKNLLSVSAVCAIASLASAQVVFSNNFESGMPAQISGAGSIVPTQGFAAYGFGNNMLVNDDAGNPVAAATVLTLTSLPAHTSLSLNFLLAVIDSWDGTNGNPAPDLFNVEVDGNLIFQTSFAHASGGGNYVAPAGGQLFFNTNVGFWIYGESAYNMGLEPALQNIAHTSSSVTIRIFASGAGWQGGEDEAWGIDGLEVTVAPTPGAAALLGLGGLAMGRRRR
jgi:MYXO-CTERM domain-containing protein